MWPITIYVPLDHAALIDHPNVGYYGSDVTVTSGEFAPILLVYS